MKIRITYIISDIDKAVAFEWVASFLNKDRYNLSFILLNPTTSELQGFLEQQKIPVTLIQCRGKKDWYKAWWRTFRYLKMNRPDVVHCHLLQANIIGLSAAFMARVKKRIYTRHHSSLHHIYHPKGVYWDKFSNFLATDIVAISSPVKKILTDWEGVSDEKVHLVPHGFHLSYFQDLSDDRIRAFRTKYNIEQKQPVIGVISRFTEWKGIQFIIPAFEKLLHQYPNAVLLLLNARGDYYETLIERLGKLPDESYRVIPFEPDVPAALHNMDVFIHTPIDSYSEAFGQIYVEALAAGIPSVFTSSGIARDFIEDNVNALLVPFKDSDAIYQAANKILSEPSTQKRLRDAGKRSVEKEFPIQLMIDKLERIYEC